MIRWKKYTLKQANKIACKPKAKMITKNAPRKTLDLITNKNMKNELRYVFGDT